MRSTIIATVLVALASVTGLSAQAVDVAEPFKVGTFEIDGVPTLALVFRDALVVDLVAANAALETNSLYSKIPMPTDMLDLIGRYEYGLK